MEYGTREPLPDCLKSRVITNSMFLEVTLDRILTELTPQEQGMFFEGFACGLDKNGIKAEQLKADHKHEIQVLCHIIYWLRHGFTWSLAIRSNRASKSVTAGQGVAL